MDISPTRRRASLGTLVAALAFAGATTSYASSAAAVPPQCPDGEPPPCAPPPPDDPPDDTVPPGPPVGWTARISILDQSGIDFDRDVRGGWVREGNPSYATPAGSVTWTNPSQTIGRLRLTDVHLPAGDGGPVTFWLRELGAEYLCRFPGGDSVPAATPSVHALLAEPVHQTPQDLATTADGFEGTYPTSSNEHSGEIEVTRSDLEPLNGSLLLTLEGHMDIDNYDGLDIDADFRYAIRLYLGPTTSPDPDQVLRLTADQGYLQIFGIEGAGAEEMEPELRAAVRTAANAGVNESIAGRPQVQWFRSLGYTVGVRRVTIDGDGVEVLPSLCKVD